MMYKNGFALAVKTSEGKTLRESNGVVYLPFESEYQIFLKNTNNRKCNVNITIDGTEVLGNNSLIIEPHSSINLERFIINGDLNSGHKFKFVQKDDLRVQDPSNLENGIIEVKFTLEKEINYIPHIGISTNPVSNLNDGYWFTPNVEIKTYYKPDSHINFLSVSNYAGSQGATIEGSKSSQTFAYGRINTLEETSTILRLKILAPINNSSIVITNKQTKHKYCINCGKKLRFKDNFCSKCGTNNRQ